MIKSKKIRESARSEDCSLRLVPCSSTETTVLCHIGRVKGVGLKCPDFFAVYGCSNCHDVLDGRVNAGFSKTELKAEALRALEETQIKLFNKGLLSVP